jgi:hypothetical protein
MTIYRVGGCLAESRKGEDMQEQLDGHLLHLAKEVDPVERDVILGRMIKVVGYTVEKHCEEDAVQRAQSSVWLTLSIGGLWGAVAVLAGVVWWLVQSRW